MMTDETLCSLLTVWPQSAVLHYNVTNKRKTGRSLETFYCISALLNSDIQIS